MASFFISFAFLSFFLYILFPFLWFLFLFFTVFFSFSLYLPSLFCILFSLFFLIFFFFLVGFIVFIGISLLYSYAESATELFLYAHLTNHPLLMKMDPTFSKYASVLLNEFTHCGLRIIFCFDNHQTSLFKAITHKKINKKALFSSSFLFCAFIFIFICFLFFYKTPLPCFVIMFSLSPVFSLFAFCSFLLELSYPQNSPNTYIPVYYF